MKDIFNKRQRFSIRKFSVGVASVLIGIALFTPSQGVLASTENSLPSVEKREAVQPISDNQNNPSSELDTRDVPIGSTRTTEPVTSGDKENNSLTTRDFVAGEDRSSTPAVIAASNPSEVKKYELTDEYAKQIKAGVIGSEGNKLDSLLLNGPQLSPEAYTDNDYLKDKEELYIYEKGGKKYVGYNSHPMLEDTDGDGIIDSNEKPDEKLKWNVSERDMIMFMELSYRNDNYIDRVLDHKKPLTESELYKKNGDRKPRYEYMMMNKELGPYWERKKSYHTSSGLDAVLYETKSDFSYLPNGTAQVLAFRGTSDVKDIKADITLGTGRNPQQGIDAENIMRELAKDKSITNLYLTGHSLGGYLVQRAMVEAYELAYSDSRVMSPKEQLAYRNFYNNVLKKGTTFNAPKVVTSLVSGREFWQKGLDSKKIAKSGKLTHYIVDNDSTIRKGVSNDSDVVINVGRTSGGHSSRSYFEADMINRRSEFISGKRISLDGTGYQDKKITTVKSVEKVGETAVYSKRGDDIIKSTTVSMKDPDTGQITKNTLDEVFKKDGAKSKVVVTPIQPSVRYEKDSTKAKGGSKVTVSGTPGINTVTTTYTVNPTDGNLIPHEGKPVIKPSTPTVVKVPAKDEVEYLKEGDDVVKKTTTYAVNASTGALTPTEKKEIFKQNGAKSKVVVTPIQPSVRYEKDSTKAKGGSKVTVSGTPGINTVTTTYTVNPTDGNLIPHEGKPVIKPSTPTVVKVPAKDEVEYLKEGDDVVKKTTTYAVNASTGALTPTEKKEIFKQNGAKSKVVVTPIQPSVRYEKDSTKAKGGSKVTVSGTPGINTVTTTYTVNPTDGNLIPHEGKPVIKPSTPTVVKVPAKDEVEYLKEGDDVVKKTTTYAVNASTGALTPTEKKEIFKQNGAKSKVVVTPIQPSVRYEKDSTKAKGGSKVTVSGTPGINTVTTTYTVNPTDGNLIPHEGKPVIKPSTPTVVKVPAKDEVEYLKEGDDVVKKTTTYAVNASTGALTPTEKKEIFKQNGAKSKVVVTPIQPSVRYEKDSTKAKGGSKVTVSGTPGINTVTTTYTVNPTDGNLIPHEGKPVIKPSTPTVVKVPAKDEVEYLKEGDDVVKKTTTYAVNASTGALTPTEKKEIFKQNGAKSKVVVTPIQPSVRYEKDSTKAKGGSKVTVSGTPGINTVTTTYTVNPTDGNLIPHEGKPVIKPSTPTVVKVPAKDEVEYLKEGDDVVKKTTSYEVNASTGALTPTVRKDIASPNGVKSKVVTKIIPVTTRYEADKTKDVGTNTVTNNGSEGKVVTTTSTLVNETNGTVTDGTPIVSRTEMVPKVVKVGAKDKVVETPIEPEVEYVKDVEKDFGTPAQRTEGEKGKTVTTTTYDVDPKDGHITEHVGNPVVTPAGKTIVKVGAKTKVEQSKDSEGRDVIDTTTYEVDPKTGKVTPTTVRTYGTTKEPTTETRPVPSPVVYEKDDSRDKDLEPVRKEGIPGEETITTTYTVDPNTGAITSTVGDSVRMKEPTNTIVKVAAKDKVETTEIPSPKKYVKDDTRDKDQPNVEEAGQAGSSTTTTTYSVDSTTGAITERVGEPVVVNPTETIVKVAAKDKVVETPIEPEVEYVRDGEREVDTPNERVEGAKGKTVTTTTYDVDSKDGHITEHVGNPVVTPAGKTIVKVGAKTKVEQSKDSEGLDVIDTTTYEVDPQTGKVTPTTVRTYGKTKEPTVEKRVVPSPVVYEKDDTKEKGTAPTTVKGEDGEDTITTTYTVDPNTGKITASEGQPVRTKEPTNTIVKVAAKDKVETTEIPSPKKYVKDDTRDKDQPNVEEAGQAGSSTTTTTYSVDSTTGAITERVGEPVVVNPTETIVKVAAKDKVVETPIEPEVEYVRDGEREVDTPNERVEGAKGKTVTTTTYDVDSKDGHITEHVGNPVVTPAGKTIVKVGAKTKVEQSKDSEGLDVIDTTTYEVDPQTGKVTLTTVRTYGKTKEPTTETRPVPSPVVYEKDDTKEKGTAPTTVKGEDGEDTITTTYTVDPNTGKIIASEGQPVRTKEPTNTIVKVPAKDKVETTAIPSPKKYVKDDTRNKDQPNVEEAGQAGSSTTTTTYSVDSTTGAITERVGEPVVVNPTATIVKVAAKDKVVETPIEPEVEYVKDVEKDFGTPAQRTEGEKGKTVTTTTYDVDPKDGHITEHVGNPVVTPAGKTIVKVGAKTKVEQSKDSEGRDVIDTTTYEVDPKTGKVTLTTVRTYGKTKEPKVELEQNRKTGDVTVIPKKPDGSTYPPGTKVEIPGKGDKSITVTIGEDGKGKVPNSELPEGKVPGTGKITEPGKPAVEVPVENPPKVTIFENGVLPASIELPELMLEVRWIDEDGNVLKSFVKTGNEKDAEHGSIPGYEFVRTVIAETEPVMTHIFRKVSSNTNTIPVTHDTNVNSGHDTPDLTTPTPIPVVPVMPDANGNSGYDTPAPTTPVPDAVAPNADQVDTKTTNDNGAKSNDSQNVLPNTGTESNATLASLGLLGMLGGLGLALGKKKED